MKLTVLSRSYCHLCDDLITALEQFRGRFSLAFEIEVVDVDSQPTIEAQWGDKVPVLLDGYACTAAAAILHALDPVALAHCQVAHRSAEPGHGRLLQRLGMEPLLDLGMRLGEGTGAAYGLSILSSAARLSADMLTFSEAAVTGPENA